MKADNINGETLLQVVIEAIEKGEGLEIPAEKMDEFSKAITAFAKKQYDFGYAEAKGVCED